MTEKHLPDLPQALIDSQRVCPILPGPALLEGERLTVRRPDRDVIVQASKKLVRQVFKWCDGTRSIDEILATMTPIDARTEFANFLDFLLTCGALIDAVNYTTIANQYAWVVNPFGMAADEMLTRQIAQRFALPAQPQITTHSSSVATTRTVTASPLDAYFTERISCYTFAEQAIELDRLDALLWSLSGIVSEIHERFESPIPRRTIASAGALHLLETYVAILRTVGLPEQAQLAPGIYRVTYPGQHLIRFEKITSDLTLIPRTVSKPWYLSYATGIIFLAAPSTLATLRYRNRAIQYLFMEAGAALQNGALCAPKLGLGFVSFGSYSETMVKTLCQIPDHLILGSAIFGAQPTPAQQALSKTCLPIDFAWADAPSELFQLPYFVGRAKIRRSGIDRPTWGRDVDPAQAWLKAVAESIERQGYREPRHLIRGKFAAIEHAVHPQQIVRFLAQQYASKNFPFEQFNVEKSYFWVPAQAHFSGRVVHLLADFVYAENALREIDPQKPSIWRSNSSGCAAAATREQAQLSALLELIERDGFMRHWLSQKPGTEILLTSLPANLQARIQAILSTGCEVSVQSFPAALAPTAFLFAQHPQRRFSCVSAGSKLNLAAALDAALVELESRIFSLLNGHAVRALTPQQVITPDDHFALYAWPKYYRRADRLRHPTARIPYSQAAAHDLIQAQALYTKLQHKGLDPIYADITPSLNGIHGGREQLWVSRAFLPGLIPMSFGYGLEPLAMLDSWHRSALFPHPFP